MGMNITLRKANAVQNSINEAVRNIKVDLTVELNEFQNIEEALTKANNSLIENDTRRQKLTMALYNIRALVGTANSQSGIDTNLAKAAFALILDIWVYVGLLVTTGLQNYVHGTVQKKWTKL